jgi:hypothetical protein
MSSRHQAGTGSYALSISLVKMRVTTTSSFADKSLADKVLIVMPTVIATIIIFKLRSILGLPIGFILKMVPSLQSKFSFRGTHTGESDMLAG